MKTDLRKLGVVVPDGDECEIRHQGVTGCLVYSEHDRTVEVRVTRKPFFVSNATVSSMLDRVMKRYANDGPDSIEEA